jgi:transcription antitermination factor NusG
MNSTTAQWYALHVRSRHEKSVATQLESKQKNVYLPLYQAKHRWADRWKMVNLPLFPGYVFCNFDPAERSDVLTTSGVIDIVRNGNEPAAVPASEIEAVRIVASSALPLEPYPTLVTGLPVIMQTGPLHGIVGTLVEVRNACRLVVSVELLKRSVLVEIDREWAAPAEPGNPNQMRATNVLQASSRTA